MKEERKTGNRVSHVAALIIRNLTTVGQGEHVLVGAVMVAKRREVF